jgi:hypothetical protein
LSTLPHEFLTQKFFFAVPAAQVTTETGIRSLVPSADIDDYVFEPCGYSMNGIAGGGFITIHITPEDGFSYASVEVSGFDPTAYDPADMVSRILSIFKPGKVGRRRDVLFRCCCIVVWEEQSVDSGVCHGPGRCVQLFISAWLLVAVVILESADPSIWQGSLRMAAAVGLATSSTQAAAYLVQLMPAHAKVTTPTLGLRS